ncbi:MAG: SOS response-associated peptidase, partial [Candidatus Competibacteraceae bacterium]|nr:SOS response-associated peptidase [Candidatus Competibacteraceae bacterium]
MCGRYGTLGLDWDAATAPLAELGRPAPSDGFQPRINLAPHQYAPIIHLTESRDRSPVPIATLARWDLVPHWWSKPLEEKRFPSFNARLETLEEKPTFRDAFRYHRCLVPVSYFIEWRNEKQGKQPYRIEHSDGRPLLLAGLWAPWRGLQRGEPLQLVSFTILVGKPNALVG